MARYKDLDLSFGLHPGTLDVLMKTDVAAIKSAMKTLLLSKKFFIPFNSDAGGDLRQFLFENITPVTIPIIRTKIIEQLSTYEPRVSIEDVIISSNIDDNALNIEIMFSVIGENNIQKLDLIIERIR